MLRVLAALTVWVFISLEALPLNFQITTKYINQMCQKAQQMVDNKFLPEWAMKDFCSLSEEEKDKFAVFVNNFHDNKFNVPKNSPQLVTLLNAETPAVGTVYDNVYNKAKSMVLRLPQNIQDMVRKWEAKNFEMVSVDRAQWFENAMKNAKEFVTDVESISEDDWDKIRVQFPEYENFWKSNKVVALRTLIKNLPDNFADNKESVQQVFDMSLAHFLPKQDN